MFLYNIYVHTCVQVVKLRVNFYSSIAFSCSQRVLDKLLNGLYLKRKCMYYIFKKPVKVSLTFYFFITNCFYVQNTVL